MTAAAPADMGCLHGPHRSLSLPGRAHPACLTAETCCIRISGGRKVPVCGSLLDPVLLGESAHRVPLQLPAWLLLSLCCMCAGSLLSLLRHMAWALSASDTRGPEAVRLVAAICANVRVDSDPHGILLRKLQREVDRCRASAAAMAAQSLPKHGLPAPPAGTPPPQLAAAARLSEAQQLWQRWGVMASASSLGQASVQIKGRPCVHLPSAEVACIQVGCRMSPGLPTAVLHRAWSGHSPPAQMTRTLCCLCMRLVKHTWLQHPATRLVARQLCRWQARHKACLHLNKELAQAAC